MIVPNSWGTLQEANRCHNPPGSPAGGQFCGDGAGKTVDDAGVTHVGKFVELYHGTSRRRAKVIARDGLRHDAVRQRTMPGDPASSRQYVWLAKKAGSARSYAEHHPNPVVVTFRIPQKVYAEMTPYGRNSGPDSVWSKEAIPAKYIHSITAATREAALQEFNRCHTPAGSSAGGRFCGDPLELRVFRTRDDVESRPGWGGDPVSWSVKGHGYLLKGAPIEREQLDKTTLYHVTTRLGKVLSDGRLKTTEGKGGGLGGGTDPVVSFTTDRKAAMNIVRTLSGIRTVLVAKDFEGALSAWAAREKKLPGINASELDRAVRETVAQYREGLSYTHPENNPEYYAYNGKGETIRVSDRKPFDRELTARADSITGFLYARESAGIKNPLVFNAAQLARHGKDWDVGLLVLPGKTVRGKALVNWGADRFQKEIEIHGDVPIKTAGYLTSRDLQRYRRGLHGLRVVKRRG